MENAPVKINHREIADRILGMLSAEGSGAPKREHKAPDLPPGVMPARRAIAMDSANNSLFNYLNQNGAYCGLGFPGYPYLAELSQRSEYRAPVETIANEL